MSSRALARLSRTCQQISRAGARGKSTMLKQTQIVSTDHLLSHKLPQIFTPVRLFTVSDDPSIDLTDYPAEVEVSYDEFKYVEQVLPKATVPEIPQHSSYPTPSGWVPPNDEIRSQQPYLVRRTKNHVLPVYPEAREVWKKIKHHIVIRNIEGDIWKLESELRQHLQGKTETDKIITQVHEVSRCIRVRGEHRAEIAQFLLDKGM